MRRNILRGPFADVIQAPLSPSSAVRIKSPATSSDQEPRVKQLTGMQADAPRGDIIVYSAVKRRGALKCGHDDPVGGTPRNTSVYWTSV
jgi:hypothetical protein